MLCDSKAERHFDNDCATLDGLQSEQHGMCRQHAALAIYISDSVHNGLHWLMLANNGASGSSRGPTCCLCLVPFIHSWLGLHWQDLMKLPACAPASSTLCTGQTGHLHKVI